MEAPWLEQLIENNDYSSIAQRLQSLHPADIAELIMDLDVHEQQLILSALPDELAGDILAEFDSEDREEILDALDSDSISRYVTSLPADDATDILSELDQEKADEVLHDLPPEDSKEINQLLQYDDDSASGIMDPELVSVPETWRISQVLHALRSVDNDEPIYYVYVVDHANHLVGTVTLQKLLSVDESRPIGSIMNRHLVTVTPDTDQEDVALLVQKYDLMAIPVVDEDNKLCGRITVDDIIDVIEDETTEDFFRLAGALRWDEDTRSIVRAAYQRLPWLVVALVGSLAGAALQRFYGNSLGKEIFTLFAPFVIVIAAMGGNIGIQSCTTIVRGLATGDIEHNVRGAILREMTIGLLVGITCAIISGSFALFTGADHPVLVSICVSISLFLSIMIAATVGAAAPATCRKLGIDPTIASGPFVTVSLDIIGIGVYFSIAIFMLKTFAS